jgi:hypothetical protein
MILLSVTSMMMNIDYYDVCDFGDVYLLMALYT